MSLLKRTGAIFVALFLTLTLVAPQSAHADATTDQSLTNASQWIADRWETKRGQFFAAGTTADGVIALSAANQQPDTVRDMLLDLKDRGPDYTDFDGGYPAGLAKIIMTADIAGQDPRTFYGCERDLVAELQAMIATPAGQKKAKEYWGPHLIAIALSRAGEPVPVWVIDHLAGSQKDGGFGYTENDGAFVPDPDYTAVGISAMELVSKNSNTPLRVKRDAANSVVNAINWAADPANQQHDDASDSQYWATYSSANSTGMLASALGEVGEDITSPVRYLKSQQKADGGWAAAHNGKKSDVMATTQAVLGVIGEGYGTTRSTQVPQMETCGTPPTSSATPTPTSSPSAKPTSTPTAKPTSTPSAKPSNAPSVKPTAKPTLPVTVYNTPGHHDVNGRKWFTTCEKYSQTTRCNTTIWATTVTEVNGRFVVSNGYVFNNLTYLPSSRSLWKGNPLGGNGEVEADVAWTAVDGRQWRTECDTALTGRGGCRTFATARVIETISKPGKPTSYRWVTKEIFNNMVQFS